MKTKMKVLAAAIIVSIMGISGMAVEPPKPYGPVPSAAQLAWHEIEAYGLVCLNMPTFTGEEWAFGDKPPSLFNPTEFSADQIARVSKEAGLNGLILVCKHHGGFCLWPTKTTDYSIKNSPYKNGKGDILGELAEATRKHGMVFGAYLSPWDRNNEHYGRPKYVELYREQWREIMTNYGELFELWLDGAKGGTGWYGGEKDSRKIDRLTYYNWPTTFEMMKELQPNAVIFSDAGPDIRWVGNESGVARDPCWATVTFPLVNGKPPAPGYRGPRELLLSGVRNGKQWLPAEADFPIRHGWYYHPNKKLKSAQELIKRYFTSVGRGASYNLGLSPDTRGLIHEEDVKVLKKLGQWKRDTFTENVARDAKATASNVRGGSDRYAAERVLDKEKDSYWCADDGELTPELVLDMGEEREFNVVNIREYLPLGQRIDDWAIDIWDDNTWREVAKGTAIGSRRLVRLDYITTSKVRLRVTKAAACPAIREFALHREPEWARATEGDSRVDLGESKKGWKIHSRSYAAKSGEAKQAIDGNVKTLWHTHGEDGERGAPQWVAVDMGRATPIKAFLYMPRSDGSTRAIVDKYEYHVSNDGETWTQVAQGEFGNIAANPVQQETALEEAVSARYFKFVALHSVNGVPLSAAEIGVKRVD